MSEVKSYRCRHAVEAMQWTDTDADREAFATWFENHGAIFETRGPVIVLPDELGEVSPGEWVTRSMDEFIAYEDEAFREEYEGDDDKATVVHCSEGHVHLRVMPRAELDAKLAESYWGSDVHRLTSDEIGSQELEAYDGLIIIRGEPEEPTR